jgi:anti-sigma regulatory factor (Ser/Thr protein kinase)
VHFREYFALDNGLYSRRWGASRRVKGTSMANGPSVPSPAGSSACSEIRIANTMSELARVAELVDAFGADHKLPNSVIVALNVSLDEILNNIISYGYDDTDHHNITVRLELGREKVEVVVEDDGKPFNPLEVAPPNLRDKSVAGGVGLHFVRSLTDDLKYARRDGVNQLRLTKKITE